MFFHLPSPVKRWIFDSKKTNTETQALSVGAVCSSGGVVRSQTVVCLIKTYKAPGRCSLPGFVSPALCCLFVPSRRGLGGDKERTHKDASASRQPQSGLHMSGMPWYGMAGVPWTGKLEANFGLSSPCVEVEGHAQWTINRHTWNKQKLILYQNDFKIL